MFDILESSAGLEKGASNLFPTTASMVISVKGSKSIGVREKKTVSDFTSVRGSAFIGMCFFIFLPKISKLTIKGLLMVCLIYWKIKRDYMLFYKKN